MMSRQFSRKLHLLLPFCRRMKLLWWCPWFKNDFSFLFAKKLVAQKNLLVEWSPPSDFFYIFYRHPIWHSHLIPHIFWHPIWIWHSIWYIYPWRFFVVEVRRGTLWYRGCCWGPAGNTLIRSLRWRSRGKHSGPELGGGGPAGNTLIQRLLLGAGNTLILSLLFGSGGENCDLELAVEARRGSLWSWACCSGPAGKTAI